VSIMGLTRCYKTTVFVHLSNLSVLLINYGGMLMDVLLKLQIQTLTNIVVRDFLLTGSIARSAKRRLFNLLRGRF